MMARDDMNDGGPSDEALAAAARLGDGEAFAELWRRHSGAGAVAARQYSHIADTDDLLAEAYLRIFAALKRGGGPHGAFRPYLYRTIVNIALDARRPAELPLDETPDADLMLPSPELAAAERTIAFRAFRALPERWQSVLWYLDVEGLDPAQAAPLLGIAPNATSALAARAREGLKKAWLQAHVNEAAVPPGCRWTTERMGEFTREGLSRRARDRFADHLATCERCTGLIDELENASGRLAVLLLPIFLGGSAAATLLAHRTSDRPSPEAGSGTPAPPHARLARLPRVRGSRVLATGAGVVASVLVVAAVTFAAVSSSGQDAAQPESAVTPSPTDPPEIPTSPVEPTPTPTPTPSTSVPPRVVPPVPPVIPPPVVEPPTAPAAPTAPTIDFDPATGRIAVTGAGDVPGATIEVWGTVTSVVTGITSPETLLATTAVAPDGSWATPDAGGLTPANVTVFVVQVRDGLSSGAVVLVTDAIFNVETLSTAATVAGPTATWQLLGWAGAAWEVREPGGGATVASGIFDAAGTATASVTLPGLPSGTIVDYDFGYVQDGSLAASIPGLTATVP